MCSSAWRSGTNERSIGNSKGGPLGRHCFPAGAALGGMVGYVFAHHTAMAAPAQMSETEKRAQKVQRLTQELNLARSAKAAGSHYRQRAGAVQSDSAVDRAAANEARQKGREQIRAILTPEQKSKFEEFLKRLDEERKRKRAVAR